MMKHIGYLLGILSIINMLLLIGCVKTPKTGTPNQMAMETGHAYDPYTKLHTINGVRYEYGNLMTTIHAQLFATIDTNGKERETVMLIGYDTRSHTIWLHSAYDIDGNQFPIQIGVEGKKIRSGKSNETARLLLSSKYIIEHADRGISMKLIGSEGSFVIDYPSEYIKGFLIKLSQVKDSIK